MTQFKAMFVPCPESWEGAEAHIQGRVGHNDNFEPLWEEKSSCVSKVRNNGNDIWGVRGGKNTNWWAADMVKFQ